MKKYGKVALDSRSSPESMPPDPTFRESDEGSGTLEDTSDGVPLPGTRQRHGQSAELEGPELERVPTLVILWNDFEPSRIGECAQFLSNALHILGREDPKEPLRRGVRFDRWRPSGILEGSELTDKRFNRKMIWCTPDKTHGLHIQSAVREPVIKVNGLTCSDCYLKGGELIQWRRQLLLLYQHRPLLKTHGLHGDGDWTIGFGEADAEGRVGESAELWNYRYRMRAGELGDAALPPPLSKRPEDIPLLLRYGLRRHAQVHVPDLASSPWQFQGMWQREPLTLDALVTCLNRAPATAAALDRWVEWILAQGPSLPLQAEDFLKGEYLISELPQVQLFSAALNPESLTFLTLLRERNFVTEAVANDPRFLGGHSKAHKIQRTVFDLALERSAGDIKQATLLLVGRPDEVCQQRAETKLYSLMGKKRS